MRWFALDYFNHFTESAEQQATIRHQMFPDKRDIYGAEKLTKEWRKVGTEMNKFQKV